MATSFQITDGTTSYQLWYNASSQTTYRQKYGAMVQMNQPDVLMHEPDFAPAVPVRGIDSNRMVTLTMDVPASATWDSIYNAIASIKRMVDGANSQALRYWTDGDVNRVALRVQQNGATNYTDIPVLYGMVDDSTAYYSSFAEINTDALDVKIVLIVGPYGEGAAISLRNDLASSPHMLEDSNSDGLADGLTVVGTHSSSSISTTNYVIGGKAQRWVAPSTGDSGVRFGDVTASTSTQAVFSVWVTAGVGADDLTIRLSDGSENLIQEKTFDRAAPAGYDTGYVFTDPAGGTWYRYTVSGTNTTAANFRPRVFRTSANASISTAFFVDGAYLQTGTTTMPNAWCSTTPLANRYDPDVAAANINYLDFWGIPGDADALVRMATTTTSGSETDMISIAQVSDGAKLASSYPFFIDSADFSTGTSWSETGTGAIGTTYKSTNVPNSNYCLYGFTGNQARKLMQTPTLIFILCYATDSATTFNLEIGFGNIYTYNYDDVSPDLTSNFCKTQVGLLVIQNELQEWEAVANQTLLMRFNVGGSTGTARVDGVWLMPLERYMVSALTTNTGALDPVIDGVNNRLFADDSSSVSRSTAFNGEMPLLKSGRVSSRLIFHLFGENSSSTYEMYSLTATITFGTLNVIPRTRHLLGVV